jgi:hypothetical protein
MSAESYIRTAYRAECTTRPAERLIAELAAEQHGVVARYQLLEAGFSTSAVGRRIEAARLHPIHAGVYAVGHSVVGPAGRRMAAALAGGVGAALGVRSAGAHWQLRSYSGPFDVIVPRARRNRPQLRFHRIAVLPDEVTVDDGIPVTTVARTLLDLAAILDRHRLAQAVGRSEQRLLTDSPSLPDLIERHPHIRGVANLRAVLADRRLGIDVAESELEVEFAAFLAERGLPIPELNVWVAVGDRWYRLDCLWREARLAVELDSRKHHSDWESAESDRARDAALLAIGIRTLRVTARRLRSERRELERELRALSASSSARSPAAGSRWSPRRSG